MWFYKKLLSFFMVYFVLAAIASCGFKPLYSDYNIKKPLWGNLQISEIFGKDGYHLREELMRRFGEPNKDAYLLGLTIETSKINEVISPSNEITSYQLIMTADYNIKNNLGAIVLPTQKSVVRTGFNSAGSSTGYTTQVAEEAAKKRLAIEIARKISTQIYILSKKWLK